MNHSFASRLALLAAAGLALAACKKDNGSDTPTAGERYVLITESDLTTGQGYLRTYAGLPTGTVDNASTTAALQTANAGGLAYHGAFYAERLDGQNGFTKYTADAAGQMTAGGTIAADSYVADFAFESDTRAYYAQLGLARIGIFNPSTMQGSGTIDVSSARGLVPAAVHGGKPMSVRSIVLHAGKLLAVLLFADDQYGTNCVDGVAVAVINPASGAVEKVTVKTGVKLGGDIYPHLQAAEEDEQGNFYLGCSGSYFPSSTDMFHVVRIPAGSTDFDGYDFNVGAASGLNSTGRGLTYGGSNAAYVMLYDYSKLPATIGPTTLFTSPVFQFVKVDLAAKTATKVLAPTIGFASAQGYREGDLTYLPINTSAENAMWTVSRSTGATQKAFVAGKGGAINALQKLNQ